MRWFRRSLAVKWLFTLLFTGLSGIGLVWFFANRATTTGFDQLKIDQAQADFETTARNYYETHGSWAGAKDKLEVVPGYNHYGPPPDRFILADESNRMIICFPPYQSGDLLGGDQLSRGTPVIVNGNKVGTVLFAEGVPSLNPAEQRYLAQTNQGLFFGAIGAALIALLIGVILTRYIMRPLRDLTLALRAMQQGNLEQQVPVRSQDELGELTRAFNHMSRDLAQANFLRRRMTADIAHDLRTPLTIIGGYLEGLQDGTLKATPQRFETMNNQVVRLKRLVEDLRTLSLADAGELKLIRLPVSVETLLSYAAESFQPLFDERRLHLEVQIEPDLPELMIDRERIEQVLSNLLTNALRHTPMGGRVVLFACKVQDAVQISVQDSGEGIPSDKLTYIFERLYRADESRSADDGGSGLGLAIVKSIVEAHGGTVSAQSELGKGTNITIRFPNPLNSTEKAA